MRTWFVYFMPIRRGPHILVIYRGLGLSVWWFTHLTNFLLEFASIIVLAWKMLLLEPNLNGGTPSTLYFPLHDDIVTSFLIIDLLLLFCRYNIIFMSCFPLLSNHCTYPFPSSVGMQSTLYCCHYSHCFFAHLSISIFLWFYLKVVIESSLYMLHINQ